MSRNWKKTVLFVVWGGVLAVGWGAVRPVATGAVYEDTRMERVSFTQLDLRESAEARRTGVYESAVLDAPIAFNALVPEWQADPTLALEVRSRKTEGTWSQWLPLHLSGDLTPDDAPLSVGEMLFVSAADTTHNQYQFRVSTVVFNVPELRFTFINSTTGPTTAELIARQQELDSQQNLPPADPTSYPKPFVISRQAWCTDSLCQTGQHSCTVGDPLAYTPVHHLIVHHTVSNNSNADWAAVMRAIWNYHTIGQCWGDIGYNYLIDINGNIYEGHRGGDDVVGTHSSGANQYSMAISLLGTFTLPSENPPGIAPSAAMQTSLVRMLAWKADQKQIDLYDATYHPVLGRGLPNFMGHRDAYGTTSCPGEQAHDLLPSIRERVAAELNFTPPHIYVDELSNRFTRSGGNWQDGPYSCGYNVHSWFTWSTTDPNQANYWGEWQLNIPTTGSYELSAYVPYCNTGAGETSSARYTIYHDGGSSQVTADQEGYLGSWVPLGTFQFSPGNNPRVRLTDLAGDNNQAVWFDAVRVRYLGPQATNQQPTANGWVNSRTVNFGWNIANGGAVTAVKLRAATDSNFTNLVYQADLPSNATSHSHTFGQDYNPLYWQILLSTTGQTIYSSATTVRMDLQPPTSTINTIAWTNDGSGYVLNWSGTDALSGVANYTLEYRVLGTAVWLPLLNNVAETHTTVVPTDTNTAYEFRIQATDVAGNVEPVHQTADISTNDAPASIALIAPANNQWVNTAVIPFQWQWLNGNTPSQARLQVSTAANFSTLLVDVTLAGTTLQNNLLINNNYDQLYWRVIPTTGPNGPAIVGQFRLDTVAPSAAVNRILRLEDGRYIIAWQGSDNLSGIAHYTVYYRAAGAADWILWKNGTPLKQAAFTPPNGQVYEFRARATDVAGNSQPASNTADLDTTAAIQLFTQGYLPVLMRP